MPCCEVIFYSGVIDGSVLLFSPLDQEQRYEMMPGYSRCPIAENVSCYGVHLFGSVCQHGHIELLLHAS